MIKICACCGHPLPDESVEADLSPAQARMFKIIKRAGSGGIAVKDIMDILYANDPSGGPDSRNIICVMAKNMRKRLELAGLTIAATRGPGSKYFLIPLSRKAEFSVRDPSTYRRWRRQGRTISHVV